MNRYIDGTHTWTHTTEEGGQGVESAMALTYASELMENYATGRVIDGENLSSIVTIRDIHGYPIVFSISSEGDLFAVVRAPESRTGWQQFNLTRGLGDGLRVRRVGVGQQSSGAFTLVIAATVPNRPGEATIFTTRALSNDPARVEWEAFRQLWHRRASHRVTDVTLLRVGTLDRQDESGRSVGPLVLAATEEGRGDHHHYQIDIDVDRPAAPWKRLDLAPQANEIVDIVIGRRRPGRTSSGHGVYVLSRQHTTRSLSFVTLEEPVRHLRLPVPEGVRALAVLPEIVDGGREATGLYCAGEGLHYLSAAEQAGRDPRFVPIASGAAKGLASLVAREDDHHIALWAVDGERRLQYVVGRKVGEAGAEDRAPRKWEAPIVLRHGVAHIAPIRNHQRETNDLVVVDTGHRLRHLTQATETTVWLDKDIPVASTGTLQSFQCHATQLTLTRDGAAAPNHTLEITASEWSEIIVNGKVHWIDATTPFKAKTDGGGTLTFLSKADTVSPPIYRVSAQGMPGRQVVNPAQKLEAGMQRLETREGMDGEKRQDGSPLLATTVKPEDREKAAQGIRNLNGARQRLPADGSVSSNYLEGVDLAAEGLPICWGMARGEEGELVYVEGDEATERIQTVLARVAAAGGEVGTGARGEAVFLGRIAGDVLEWIKNAVSKAWTFFVQAAGNAWEFLVTIGNQAYKFIIECLGHVYNIVNWVLEKTLGLKLDDILQWIGFLFDGEAIRTTQKVLRNVAEQVVVFMGAQVGTARRRVGETFKELERQLQEVQRREEPAGAWGQGSFQGESTEVRDRLPEEGRDTFDLATRSPGGNFAAYQLTHGEALPGAGDVSVAAFGEENALRQFFENLGKLMKDLEATFQKFGVELADFLGQGDLTPNQVIKKLLSLGSETLLGVARAVVDSILAQAELLLRAVAHYATQDVPIPFIKELYYLFMGERPSKVSLLDLFSLLFAVPATAAFKVLTGKAPFAEGTGELDTLKGEALFHRFRDYGTDALDAASNEAVRTWLLVSRLVTGALGAVVALLRGLGAYLESKKPGWLALPVAFLGMACTTPIGSWTGPRIGHWVANIDLFLIGVWNTFNPLTNPLDKIFSGAMLGLFSLLKIAMSLWQLILAILAGGPRIVLAIFAVVEQVTLFVTRALGVGARIVSEPQVRTKLVLAMLGFGTVTLGLQIGLAIADYCLPPAEGEAVPLVAIG